jgi:hypothetical protein
MAHRIASIFLILFAGVALAEVDPRYVGRWRFEWDDPKGHFAIDFEVTAAGLFKTKTVGPGVLVEDEGTFEAKDGRYAYQSQRTPAKDQGRYEFDAAGRLVATGSAGPTVAWTRVDAQGKPAATAPATGAIRPPHPSADGIYKEGQRHYKLNDMRTAAVWFERAARLGHVDGQLQIGWHYEMGEGVGRDEALAAAWYKQAALRGSYEAMKNYGQMLEDGRGVPENWVEAARWYQKSTHEESISGCIALARAYEFGIGVPQNRAKAIELNRRVGRYKPDCAQRAVWLSDPTNYIGFRNRAEKDFVMDGKLRFSAEFHGGDPAGQMFRNSFERNRFLLGFKAAVDKDEAETWRQVAEADARRKAEQKAASDQRDQQVASYIAQGYSQSAAERKADR